MIYKMMKRFAKRQEEELKKRREADPAYKLRKMKRELRQSPGMKEYYEQMKEIRQGVYELDRTGQR